jgi:hypothetical protein
MRKFALLSELIVTILLAVLFCSTTIQKKNTLVGSQPIKAGGRKGLAPLFFSMSNSPQGTAFVSKSEYPDIFTVAVSGIKPLGLFRCKFCYIDGDRRLVYSAPEGVKHPFGEKNPPVHGRIFDHGEDVLGLWIDSEKNVVIARYERDINEFVKFGEIPITGNINPIAGIEVSSVKSDTLKIILLCSDGQAYRPKTFPGDTQSYYDGAGSYRGKLPLCGLYSFEIDLNLMRQASSVKKITREDNLAISGSRVVKVGSENGILHGYIVTNTLGVIKYLPISEENVLLSDAKHVFKDDHSVLYHPTHGARAVSVSANGSFQNEFIVGGEGAIYHYRFSGRMTKNNEPIFDEPKLIVQENADLYAGSLTVPNVVDWDGDGSLDIVSGNSEGRLLFFKNNGSNISPDFAFPEEIRSAGKPVLFRPGYNIVQGPLESAWGYLCPTVYDWNGDGLLDIVFSGSRSKFEVMINRGSPKAKPELDAPVPLRIDNMELPGTWRVRPAIARINGRNAIVILDTDNALHLYWQVYDYTVEDGGKLHMADSSPITFHNNREPLGQTGRAKLQLVDWDNDGILDLIVGTIKRASFPNPDRGLPYSRYLKNEIGLQAFFMRNIGTNKEMKFAEPLQFQVNGNDFYLGAHSNAPFACGLGDTSNGLNLVIGVESGKIYFFDRKDLTTTGIDN